MSFNTVKNNLLVSVGEFPQGIGTALGVKSLMMTALTGMPKCTWWFRDVLQYTNCQFGSMKQQFDSGSNVGFGSVASVDLESAGDMLYFMYLIMELPGIEACPLDVAACGVAGTFAVAGNPTQECAIQDQEALDNSGGEEAWYRENGYGCPPENLGSNCGHNSGNLPDYYAYWCNSVAQVIASEVTLTVSGNPVDIITSEMMYIEEEFMGRPGARLESIIGRWPYLEDLVVESAKRRLLYLPLPFWFTKSPGQALHMCSLNNKAVRLRVQFRALSQCVVQSGSNVKVVKCPADGGGPLTNRDLSAVVDCTYAVLTAAEAERYQDMWYEQLVEVNHSQSKSVSGEVSTVDFSPTGPVTWMAFAARRECALEHNNHFNFTGIRKQCPILQAEIRCGGTVRVPWREAEHYTFQQPYQYMQNTPDNCVFLYSFALDPANSKQPTGAMPMGRMRDNQIAVRLQEGLARESPKLIIVWRQINAIMFRGGSGRLVFQR